MPNGDGSIFGPSRGERANAANLAWTNVEPLPPRASSRHQAYHPSGNRERTFDWHAPPAYSRISSDEIRPLSTPGSEITIAAAWVIDASKLAIEDAMTSGRALGRDGAINIVSQNLDRAMVPRPTLRELTPYRVLLTAHYRVKDLIASFEANLDPGVVAERQRRSAAFRATKTPGATRGGWGGDGDAYLNFSQNYFDQMPVASAIAGINAAYAKPASGGKRVPGIDYTPEGLAALRTLLDAIDGLLDRIPKSQLP
jgi:hypothetical protein